MSKEVKEETEDKIKSIAGFVCSIFGILLVLMPYIGIVFSILGIVWGNKSKRGLSVASKVIGIVGTVLNSIMLLFLGLMLLITFAIGV